MTIDSFITAAEAAELIQCSVQHARGLARTGELIAEKVGGAWLIDYESVKALLSCTREAFTNVFRHAKASRVVVRVDVVSDAVALTIEDDGVGFSADGEWLHVFGPTAGDTLQLRDGPAIGGR